MANLPFIYQKTVPRIRAPRQPWDERLPDGRTVDEAVAAQGAPDYGSMEVRTGENEGLAPPRAQPAIDPKIIQAARQSVAVQEPQKPTPTSPAVTDPRMDYGPPPATAQEPTTAVGKMPEPPPPMVWDPMTTDKQGRPKVSPTAKGDPLEIALREQAAVRKYEPQKAKGWRRYLLPILQGWAAGQGSSRHGSPWAGAGGAIVGALTGQFHPEAANEQWKARKEAEVGKRVEGELETRKTQAQIDALRRGPKRETQIVKSKDGTYRAIDKATGLDIHSGQPVQGETKETSAGAFKGWVHDSDGVAHYYDNGVDTGRLDPGRNKVRLPDGRLIDPTSSYVADRQAGQQSAADLRENEETRQYNAQLQARISELEKIEAQTWAWRDAKGADGKPLVPQRIKVQKYDPATGQSYQVEEENPEWRRFTDDGNRHRHEILRLKSELKPVVTPRSGTSSPRFETPPVTYTEKQVRERWKETPANKRVHKTEDEAVKAARDGGLIPK